MSNRYRATGGGRTKTSDLIGPVRELLSAWAEDTGKLYVIENVDGAKHAMRDPVRLTGGMFGLRVVRPRLFEANFEIPVPEDHGVTDPIGVYGRSPDGRRLWTRADKSVYRCARSVEEGREAMGISRLLPWNKVTEAIPPAYTLHVGTYAAAALGR